MQASAFYAEKINAPVGIVWPYFDWSNLDLMIPSGFVKSVDYMERRAVIGATRRVTFGDGRSIIERLERLPDHPLDMAYEYRVADVGDFPLAEYVGSVRLTPAGEKACAIRMSCLFTPLGIAEDEWRKLYQDMQKLQIGFIRSQVEK